MDVKTGQSNSSVTKLPSKGSDLRSYYDAWQLVDWLNLQEPPGARLFKMPEERTLYVRELRAFKRHQKKAERAIGILRELNSMSAKERSEGSPRIKGLADELDRITRPLQHLRWRRLRDRAGRLYLDCTYDGDTDYGLLLIARLSKRGLEWVRRCSCGKWFFAYSSRNRFHSDECREAFWAGQLKTPEGRRRRRDYMRKHRALLRQKPNLKRKRGT